MTGESSGLLRDADYPADPYPGARPDCSFVHRPEGDAHRLHPVRAAEWRVAGLDLASWLRREGAAGLDDRVPVLAYGSNACPGKIAWLRATLGLTGPAVVLRCRTVGVGAVWSAVRRPRDGQVPAVLAAMPGRVETHALWLADPEQLAVLDRCEGRGERYELMHLEPVDGAGVATEVEVRTEDGSVVHRPLAYVTHGPLRAPLLHEGRYLPVADLDQAGVRRLVDAGAVAGPHDDACGLVVSPGPAPAR